MDNKDQIAVITMRCINMAPSGCDVEKRPCTKCGEMTWLSSSWKGKKIDKIICAECFYKSNEYKGDDHSVNVTEECLEEAKNWAKSRLNIKKTDEEIKSEMMKIMEDKIGKKLTITRKEDRLFEK